MRFWLIILVVLLARVVAAQAPDTTRRAAGATVSGVVRDSIAHAPLAGAMVQLVAADSLGRFGRTVVADSLGQFTVVGVPDGRYTLGFFHPMLDSLGVEPPLREVHVDGQRPMRADLATPSPARLRTAICGARSTFDSGAVVLGVVRDARDGTPAAGATVTGEWVELTFGPGGVVRRVPRLVATTKESGWFALCDVPSAGTMALAASRGADSTDLIEVQVPTDGFLRRELYIGAARTVVTGDGAPRGDTLAPPRRRLHLGDGRLNGTVATIEGRPLVDAQVSIADGPQTRADERGEWTLVDAPLGTRMLEVRSLGYYPERRPVHVVAGAAPVRVALSTLKSVLDTVRVTARSNTRDRNAFEGRRRAGVGRFVTPQDIERRGVTFVSDIFRTVSGVRVDVDSSGIEKRILMRGAHGLCAPAIYLDGSHIDGITAGDIDVWVKPKDIAGIEVYPDASAPPQYQVALSGCGSILIWTK